MTTAAPLVLLAAIAPSQVTRPEPRPDLAREPVLPPQTFAQNTPTPPLSPLANRIRLLRIQPGFLSEPGMEEELTADASDGLNFVSVAFGNDNPFFDFRQRGDPGGVGYARVNTQVQLFETESTAFSLGLNAVTPAGIEYDGLPDRKGPTVLSPALSVFHTLDESLAVQAFVAKNMPIQNSATMAVKRDVQYGMALHRALASGDDPLRNLYVSVGALGQYNSNESQTKPVIEVLPGLHYRAGENWWISGALSVPVRQRDAASQQWQVTCAMQF